MKYDMAPRNTTEEPREKTRDQPKYLTYPTEGSFLSFLPVTKIKTYA
jgi:hypothetical protein